MTRYRLFLPRYRVAALEKFKPSHSEQGLTLIECLVAIVMVALVASTIAPALVLSVATRVQSQKSEQALQLAQSEIDQVRLQVEQGDASDDTLPRVADEDLADADIATVPGPQFGDFVDEDAADPRPTPTQTRPVDITGDDEPDFAVQIFRSPGLVEDDVPLAFNLGVRVYDYDAVNSDQTGNLLIEPASLRMVSGEGQRSQRPLATLYTTVAVSEASESLCSYYTYFNTGLESADQKDLPLGCTGVEPPESTEETGGSESTPES